MEDKKICSFCKKLKTVVDNYRIDKRYNRLNKLCNFCIDRNYCPHRQKYTYCKICNSIESIKNYLDSCLENGIDAYPPSYRFKHLNCDLATLKNHIEQQFTGNMSWDNYEEFWYIGIPIKNNAKHGQFLRSVHYTNTKPFLY